MRQQSKSSAARSKNSRSLSSRDNSTSRRGQSSRDEGMYEARGYGRNNISDANHSDSEDQYRSYGAHQTSRSGRQSQTDSDISHYESRRFDHPTHQDAGSQRDQYRDNQYQGQQQADQYRGDEGRYQSRGGYDNSNYETPSDRYSWQGNGQGRQPHQGEDRYESRSHNHPSYDNQGDQNGWQGQGSSRSQNQYRSDQGRRENQGYGHQSQYNDSMNQQNWHGADRGPQSHIDEGRFESGRYNQDEMGMNQSRYSRGDRYQSDNLQGQDNYRPEGQSRNQGNRSGRY